MNKRINKTKKIKLKFNKTKKIEKMNCSPIVKNKTIQNNSCYTPDVLNEIKNAYNKNNKLNQIIEEEPKEIWLQLNERLNHCKKEDCWLQEIKNEEIKNKIDKYIFAPDYPKEWEDNPNEWLSNYDILDVLKQYEKTYSNFEFIGPCAIDFDKKLIETNNNCVENRLCNFYLENFIKRNKNKIGVIFNLDKHDEDGSHWISLFIDIKNKLIFYFDSNGEKIPPEIEILIKRIIEQGKNLKKPIYFNYDNNTNNEHQTGNTECGMYSLFFIITMLTNSTDFNKKMSMKEKIKLFKNKKIPDKYVEKYRKIYFNSP